MEKTKELEDLAGFGSDLVDTIETRVSSDKGDLCRRLCLPLNSDNEDELSLGRDIVGAFLLAQAVKADLFTLCIAVLLNVGFGTFENDTTLLLSSLLFYHRRQWHPCFS